MYRRNDWPGMTHRAVWPCPIKLHLRAEACTLKYMLHRSPHLFLLLELESPTSSRLFDMSAGCIENVELYPKLEYSPYCCCTIIYWECWDSLRLFSTMVSQGRVLQNLYFSRRSLACATGPIILLRQCAARKATITGKLRLG